MKQFLTTALAIIIICISAPAQVIKDKRAFAEAFIKVFEQRATGFDSLASGSSTDEADLPTVILPGAFESYISGNRVYGALYRGPDSIKMLGLYNEMKQLLAYVASFYKASVKFKTFYADNPYYEEFFFADSNLFTSEGSNISFSKAVPPKDYDRPDNAPPIKDSFEVLLLINPGNPVCYYTSSGKKLQDPEVKEIISQIAFGKDPMLNGIKINKRVQKDASYYDSKLNLKGFKTEIREGSDTKKTYMGTTLTRIVTTSNEESFLRTADSLVLKVKSAIPPGYCYDVYDDEEEITVEFKPIPFLKDVKNPPDIAIIYSELKHNMYKLELRVGRLIPK